MATVLLASAGAAAGQGLGLGAIGALAGRALGSYVGGRIDDKIFGGQQRQEVCLARLMAYIRVENMERSQREIAGDVKEILETLNKGKGGVRVFWAVATISTSAALISLIKSFTA